MGIWDLESGANECVDGIMFQTFIRRSNVLDRSQSQLIAAYLVLP